MGLKIIKGIKIPQQRIQKFSSVINVKYPKIKSNKKRG